MVNSKVKIFMCSNFASKASVNTLRVKVFQEAEKVYMILKSQ